MSDDDDDDACRICRGRAEPGSAPLLSPCACDGSIAFVHEDCLEEWLRHTHASSCELCGVEFHFEPLLAPDAPRELPRWKLALALGQRLSRFGPVLGRWLAVFLLWGIFLPLAIWCAPCGAVPAATAPHTAPSPGTTAPSGCGSATGSPSRTSPSLALLEEGPSSLTG